MISEVMGGDGSPTLKEETSLLLDIGAIVFVITSLLEDELLAVFSRNLF